MDSAAVVMAVKKSKALCAHYRIILFLVESNFISFLKFVERLIDNLVLTACFLRAPCELFIAYAMLMAAMRDVVALTFFVSSSVADQLN